jgi:DNA polymerase
VTAFLRMDFETASRADLKKVGLDVYARHPSTRVLMMGYQIDLGDGLGPSPVRLWEPHKGPMPRKLSEMIVDPQVKKSAFNAAFERAIFGHVLMIDTDPSEWICSMVMALSLGLPGKLETLVRDALQLDRKYWKDSEGDKLMRLFSYPHSTATWESHPVEWEKYCNYCRQDVVAEAKVYSVLRRYVPNMDKLFRGWAVDQQINQRGLPIDIEFIKSAQALAIEAKARYKTQMSEFTGLANPNSTQQVLPWLAQRGYPFASLAKNRVKIAVHDFKDKITPEAHKFIDMRLESNKTSLAKYDAIERASSRGRLRGVFQYYGAAATGRYAGRIIGQNIPRPHKIVEDYLPQARKLIAERDLESIDMLFGKPLEVLASSIRSAIATQPGKKLVVADFASVELCVGAWLTNARFWLNVIERGLDAYKAFGEKWLGVPYDQLTKQQRNDSKPPCLGCQFMLSGGREVGEYPDTTKTGLWGYAANMGIDLSKVQSKEAVKIYRELTPETVAAWYEMGDAAMRCVDTREPQRAGMFVFDYKSPFLRMRLPSGRYLHYCRPRIEEVEIEYEDEDGQVQVSRKMGITYERLSQASHKWVRRGQHGGRFFQNGVQAVALDLLQNGIEKAHAAGFNIVGTMHDEIIAEESSRGLEEFIEVITDLPKWAEGMPLRAEGYEATFYRK